MWKMYRPTQGIALLPDFEKVRLVTIEINGIPYFLHHDTDTTIEISLCGLFIRVIQLMRLISADMDMRLCSKLQIIQIRLILI
jgi:hypothetical protein